MSTHATTAARRPCRYAAKLRLAGVVLRRLPAAGPDARPPSAPAWTPSGARAAPPPVGSRLPGRRDRPWGTSPGSHLAAAACTAGCAATGSWRPPCWGWRLLTVTIPLAGRAVAADRGLHPDRALPSGSSTSAATPSWCGCTASDVPPYMNALHLCFGMGAFIGPLIDRTVRRRHRQRHRRLLAVRRVHDSGGDLADPGGQPDSPSETAATTEAPWSAATPSSWA